MKKTFVLDTNILLHNSDSLFAFEDNDIVLPIHVIEELDRFKKETDEKGRNAREVARILDRLRENGSLMNGVENGKGGKIQVLVEYEANLPDTISLKTADNQILAAAKFLQSQNRKRQVIFVSKDINARIKADALNLYTADFETNKINFDELYQGWRELPLKAKLLDQLIADGSLPLTADPHLTPKSGALVHNEYLILKGREREVYARVNLPDARIEHLIEEGPSPWGIQALNAQQRFALDCLLNEDIKLVTLVGKAGTGKTLLALAAGLQRAIDDLAYKRMLVSRPIMPMGRDIGYLPGSKEEKLTHWMLPIFDNLSFIFDNYITDGLPSEHLDFLFKNDKISLEALTYIRGRSIANQWLVVDESQNLTPHEVKTIISRAGNGTKIILTGDPYQIDNPYLDPSSNGLTYVVERFKGQAIFGHVFFEKSERSLLSALAVELL